MKLYITGSTGFLGRFVAEAAMRRGHSVRAVVRPASNPPPLGRERPSTMPASTFAMVRRSMQPSMGSMLSSILPRPRPATSIPSSPAR